MSRHEPLMLGCLQFNYIVVQLQLDFGIFVMKCSAEGITNVTQAHNPSFQLYTNMPPPICGMYTQSTKSAQVVQGLGDIMGINEPRIGIAHCHG